MPAHCRTPFCYLVTAAATDRAVGWRPGDRPAQRPLEVGRTADGVSNASATLSHRSVGSCWRKSAVRRAAARGSRRARVGPVGRYPPDGCAGGVFQWVPAWRLGSGCSAAAVSSSGVALAV
ncbi:hypothetical protein GCM10009665_06300 [Kitasatospora nipponensis]|uniref:Uncharacterized protein n=1 Tax=Kitasatospora nipponensis TaxID=258049 RepID=A0ABP4GAG5_9ACTN